MTTSIRKSINEKDKGFTLIELLVVIIIIGILAAIAIPVFLNQRKKGVDSGIKADLKNAATAAETITTENPASTTAFDLTTLTAAGFKPSPGNVFNISGTPQNGNFCISGHNPGGTTTDATAEYKYDALNGGLQSAKGAAC